MFWVVFWGLVLNCKNILFGCFFLLSLSSVLVMPMDLKTWSSLTATHPSQENLNSLFLEACEDGDLKKVKQYLELGADKDARDSKFGYSGRHYAARGGQLRVLKFLSQDDDGQDRCLRGFTPMHLAAMKDHLDVVKWHVSKGADINCKSTEGVTPLFLAAESNAESVANFLLSMKGILIDQKNSSGARAVHYAVQNGSLEVLKLLAVYGADLDALYNGGNLLHFAVQQKNVRFNLTQKEMALIERKKVAVVKFLINTKKFDLNAWVINSEDPLLLKKRAALHLAAEQGFVEVGRILLESGADIHAQESNGEDAFAIACKLEKFDFATMLLYTKKIDINRRIGEAGLTCFHIAASLGNVKVVNFLLEKGADYTIALTYGITAEDLAESRGHSDMVKRLQEIAAIKKAAEEQTNKIEAQRKKAAKNKEKRERQRTKKALAQASDAEKPLESFDNMPDATKKATPSPEEDDSGDNAAPKKLVKRAASFKNVLEDAIGKISPPGSPKKGNSASPKKSSPANSALPREGQEPLQKKFQQMDYQVLESSENQISLESSQSENSSSQRKFVVIRNDRPGYKKSSIFLYENEAAGTYIYDSTNPTLLVPVPELIDNVGSRLARNHYENAKYSPHVQEKRKLPNDCFHNFPESVEKNNGHSFYTVVTDFRLHPKQKAYWGEQLGKSAVENYWFELKSEMPARINMGKYPSEKAERLGPNGRIESVVLASGLSKYDDKTVVHHCFRLNK